MSTLLDVSRFALRMRSNPAWRLRAPLHPLRLEPHRAQSHSSGRWISLILIGLDSTASIFAENGGQANQPFTGSLKPEAPGPSALSSAKR